MGDPDFFEGFSNAIIENGLDLLKTRIGDELAGTAELVHNNIGGINAGRVLDALKLRSVANVKRRWQC